MQREITFEELTGFITELRSRGFTIGIDQYIAVQRLLESVVARERLKTNPVGLLTLIAPILCSRAEQQEEFYRAWLDWLERRAGESRSEAEGTWRANPIVRFARERRFQTWRLLVAIVAIAGATALYNPSNLFRNEPYLPRFSRPVPTDGLGSDRGASGLAGNGVRPGAVSTSRGRSMVGPPRPGTADTAMVYLTVPVEPGFYMRNYTRIRFGAAMLPLVALGVWAVSLTRRKQQLERQRISILPRFTRINFPREEIDLFTDQEFRRRLQTLRRHRVSRSRDLDPIATVERTVRSGGLFVPVYAPRHVMPEYLVLVDRAGASDQQALYFDRIIDALVEEGAYVERYYFHGNPRSVVRSGSHGTSFSLAELAALHADHRLLIFSDGEGLFNPIDGSLHHWLDLFATWDLRVLLTPGADARNGNRREALAAVGFLTLPANIGGVSALSRMLHSEPQPDASTETRPFPELLLEERDRWLGPLYPGSDVDETLRIQLLDYLGADGYFWLAACALFPAVQWELTLDLGRRLMSNEQMESILPALVRLPWFRHGMMPEWFRIAMIESLPDEQLRQMRRVVDEMLEESSRRVDGIELRLAGRKGADVAKPLFDYVFLCFLRGRKPKQSSLRVPKSLRRILRPEDGSGFDHRPLLQVSLVLFCLSVTVALLLNPPIVPAVPTIAATPASGEPGREYTLQMMATNAPEKFFDSVELRVLDGRPLSITMLHTSDAAVTARLVIPDSEGDRERSIYRKGKELVLIAVLQRGRIIGSFPFTVRHQ